MDGQELAVEFSYQEDQIPPVCLTCSLNTCNPAPMGGFGEACLEDESTYSLLNLRGSS